MKRSEFRFADPLRVRWAEVDMQKVVFNGHYLMYVDTAMGNWWRALALPYEATLAALDGDLLRAAGVAVDLELYRGVTHDFIKLGRMLPEAALAQQAIADALRKAFE